MLCTRGIIPSQTALELALGSTRTADCFKRTAELASAAIKASMRRRKLSSTIYSPLASKPASARTSRESDRIRDELASMGITLKDTKNKETGEIETTWEVAR